MVQPLLIPRRLAVQDFIDGPAPIFEGDAIRDRHFLDQVLKFISVRSDGTISLMFREESLFGNIESYSLKDVESPTLPVEEGRRRHTLSLARNLIALKRLGELPKNPVATVVERLEGPNYVVGDRREMWLAQVLGRGNSALNRCNDPDGIRTHVPSVRGWCPNR